MSSYEAILKGNEVEWLGEMPDAVRTKKPVYVEIVLLEESAQHPRTQSDPKAMFAALEKIARMGGVKSIPDPVVWQRETRKDRPLPGRES
ncbi:MAG: hypothetical protein AAB209_01400 [Bacteroidota bacterium]|jgi:hypothetical protein